MCDPCICLYFVSFGCVKEISAFFFRFLQVLWKKVLLKMTIQMFKTNKKDISNRIFMILFLFGVISPSKLKAYATA